MREVKILVVSSDSTERNHTVAICKELAKNVDAADGGNEALSRHQKDPYDLIIADCEMIGMSGWDLAGTIRKEGPRPDVLILALSMAEGDREVEFSKRAKMVGHFLKPLPDNLLRLVIAETLDRLGETDRQ